MGTIKEIYDMKKEGAIEIPAGVSVIASNLAMSGLRGLEADLQLLPCAPQDAPPLDNVAKAKIVVMEVDPASAASIDRVDLLREALPHVPIIACLAEIDIRTSRMLMRKGVRDIVGLPFQIEELLAAIADAHRALLQQSATPPDLAPFLVVTKSIGGAGATTIATHLAAALAEQRGPGAKVCLIDCDLQSGDVGAFLGCTPRLTVVDLLEAEGRLDEELLRSVVCSGDERVDIITAPSDIQPVEALDFDRLMDVVTLARRHYDIVLLDLPASLTNWAVSVIFAATRVLQVGTLSLTSLRHAKRQLQFLQALGLERDRIDIVVNRVEQRIFKPIGSDDAAQALNMPITASIVSDPASLGSAQDEGVLVLRTQHRSKFAKQMRDLAQTIASKLEKGV